jgi:hypothetical protein
MLQWLAAHSPSAQAQAQTPDVNDADSAPSPPPVQGLNRGTGLSGSRWYREPRAIVWAILAVALLMGGGRKLLMAWRGRRVAVRLSDPDVTPDEIKAAADHGRSAVYELLRIFSSTGSDPQRQAAGTALARLWLLDELVPEEEQAVVRRGYTVNWSARRRYPRAISTEIPINITYEVPFLEDGGRRVGPSNLEWSHRVLGARRAALETFSPWTAGRGHVSFTIIPGDFETKGPHRLALETRVRTGAGLTDSWEIELPHMPFTFEFDPILQLEAIASLPDAAREQAIARAVRLVPAPPADGDAPRFLALGTEWTLRNPPRLEVATPLACDLAHAIAIEFDGSDERLPAGQVILSGQGLPRRGELASPSAVRRFDLGAVLVLPPGLIERAGVRRMRVWLEADTGRGWADPDVRSIWPGRLQTDWVNVEIVRR